MNIVLGYFFCSIYFVTGLFFCKILCKKIKNSFYIRKVLHCLIFFEWIIMAHFFGASVHTVISCFIGSIAVILLYRSKLFGYAITTDGKLHGSFHYAIIALILSIITAFLPQYFIHFGITMCSLSMGDGVAGVLGKLSKGKKLYREKTVIGTVACFVTVLGTLFLFKAIYSVELSTISILFIAELFSVAELLAPHFYDNIVTSSITFISLIIFTEIDFPHQFSCFLFSIPLILVFVVAKRALTVGGSISAAICSLVIVVWLGDFAFFMLIIFFLGSSVCDNIKRKQKETLLYDIHNVTPSRSAPQVLACAFFPCLASILYMCTKSPICLFTYTATIAESLGDTVASEIGVLSKHPPYDIFKQKKVLKGISGGVSPLGILSSMIAITLITLLYTFYVKGSIIAFATISTIAFLGTVCDSFLGSIVQQKNTCTFCGTITERKTHCNLQTKYCSGIKHFNNTCTNFFSNMFTFAFASFVAIHLNL